MRSYLGPSWTNSCKIWCVGVFNHVLLKSWWSWKFWNAKTKIWWRHTSVFYKHFCFFKQQFLASFGGVVSTMFIIGIKMCAYNSVLVGRLISTGLLICGIGTLLQSTFGSRWGILLRGYYILGPYFWRLKGVLHPGHFCDCLCIFSQKLQHVGDK